MEKINIFRKIHNIKLSIDIEELNKQIPKKILSNKTYIQIKGKKTNNLSFNKLNKISKFFKYIEFDNNLIYSDYLEPYYKFFISNKNVFMVELIINSILNQNNIENFKIEIFTNCANLLKKSKQNQYANNIRVLKFEDNMEEFLIEKSKECNCMIAAIENMIPKPNFLINNYLNILNNSDCSIFNSEFDSGDTLKIITPKKLVIANSVYRSTTLDEIFSKYEFNTLNVLNFIIYKFYRMTLLKSPEGVLLISDNQNEKLKNDLIFSLLKEIKRLNIPFSKNDLKTILDHS